MKTITYKLKNLISQNKFCSLFKNRDYTLKWNYLIFSCLFIDISRQYCNREVENIFLVDWHTYFPPVEPVAYLWAGDERKEYYQIYKAKIEILPTYSVKFFFLGFTPS